MPLVSMNYVRRFTATAAVKGLADSLRGLERSIANRVRVIPSQVRILYLPHEEAIFHTLSNTYISFVWSG